MSFKLAFYHSGAERTIDIMHPEVDAPIKSGIEIGTLESFYSFENASLGLVDQETAISLKHDACWSTRGKLKFKTAHLSFIENGSLQKNEGLRTLDISAKETSYLMDSVIRFVIPKQIVRSAKVGQRTITHEKRNRYHQYPLDEVTLSLTNGASINFYPQKFFLPRGFAAVVYLRDEPRSWVLHYRALALDPCSHTLKGCCRLYNKPIPRILETLIFKLIPRLRKDLLYIRERVSQRIPFQVNGAAKIGQDERIFMSVLWRLDDER